MWHDEEKTEKKLPIKLKPRLRVADSNKYIVSKSIFFHPLHNYANKRNISLFLSLSLFDCVPFSFQSDFFLFNRIRGSVWIAFIFAVVSAGSFRKQKITSNAAMKNSSLAKDIYLTQQHMMQRTR